MYPTKADLQFFVGGVCVNRGCQRADVPRKSLGQEEISRSPVHIRHRRMPNGMKRIQPVEPRSLLRDSGAKARRVVDNRTL